jgi:hypothetical protein
MTSGAALCLATLAVLVATGCASSPRPMPVAATPVPTPPAAAPARLGQSAYRFLPDPSAKMPEWAENEGDFQKPVPVRGRQPLPEYPEQALEDGVGDAWVTVRIRIGLDGTLTAVTDSPLEASWVGPGAAAFRQSVERALRRWQFEPGFFAKRGASIDADGDGAPDATRIDSWTRVPVYYDIRFDFRIVDGAGQVTSTNQGGREP